ncbi:ABC transporter permease [Streptomyces spectabilis]|uniref:ABC transporter permease n=1 Tax=Streptomyces spectabilis TaxID=68270 RepID=A0A516RGN5_STRST|nr:ABC transporter permease [Streptomyces spectabilis]QDQ14804.1 ABC transporter permease [Streptomyces spectabilis]
MPQFDVFTDRPLFGQFPTALRFSVREQSRNRLAALLLVLFVPAWYLLMTSIAGHKALDFKLYATGEMLHVDGKHITLITAGLNSLTMISGFVVFDAVRKALAFDKRLAFAGYRQSTLIGAKMLAIAIVAGTIALYTALALLLYWRPGFTGWATILAGFLAMTLTYGSLGLFLGVLVKNDLEGFFLIIMGGLTDTFLQNPLGNPAANKPVLQYFPSFGPMQFSAGGALGDTVLWRYLGLGLAWAAFFAVVGLAVFHFRTRSRRPTR